MIGRLFLALSAVGFAASALVHLATFTRWTPRDDTPALLLFAGAFVPLIAMVVRLRSAARSRPDRRPLGWRQAVALLPPAFRMLVVAAVLYGLMNMVLSLALTGGATVEQAGDAYYLVEGDRRVPISAAQYAEHRRVTVRLLSGHLLLFYLLPLAYFRFVDARRHEPVVA